jgi:plasmid stabilization system protein ParE
MIEWTEQAIRQLDQAHDYIDLSNSELVATRITMQVVSSVQQLGAFRMSGRLEHRGDFSLGFFDVRNPSLHGKRAGG